MTDPKTTPSSWPPLKQPFTDNLIDAVLRNMTDEELDAAIQRQEQSAMSKSTTTARTPSQQEFAQMIGRKLHGLDVNLVPIGPHGSFVIDPMTSGNHWVDERVPDIAWWAVAMQLNTLTGGHIIDHAWLAGWADRLTETWALVTEPYIGDEQARAVAILAADAMAGWGLDFHVFPKEASSWNPGRCTPIVATFRPGMFATFFRGALMWALTGPLS